MSTLGICCALNSKIINGLILNEKLDEDHSYEANRELVRWEETMKKHTECKTFRD